MFCWFELRFSGALRIPAVLAGLAFWLAAAVSHAAEPGAPFFAGLTPQHAVAADFNGDGHADLAVATAFDDRVSIFHQMPAGTWTLAQTIPVGLNTGANQPRFLRTTDFTGDGFPDLVVLCSGGFAFGAKPSLQTLINLGDGRFGRLPAEATVGAFPSEKFPVQFVLADVTGNAYDDAIIANLDGDSLTVMMGDGTGRFLAPQDIPLSGPGGAGPADLAAEDINGDGRADIIAATAARIFILRQMHGGGLAAPAALPAPAGPHSFTAIACDDLDGDGRLDVAAADEPGAVVIWFGVNPMNNTALRVETRQHPSLAGCTDIIALPWDNDLRPDLAVCNRAAGTVTVLGSAGGEFVHGTGTGPRRIEAGDLDGDGRLDLLTANEGDQANPQNSDVSWIRNPRAPLPLFEARLDDATPLPPLFEGWSPHPAALSAPREDRVWLLARNRRALMEFDADGEARNGGQPRHTFGFAAGGFDMTGDDEGFAVERFAARIHEFEIGENVTRQITFNFAPGELGFTGLAFDRALREFFISAPAKNAVVRVSETGQVLQTLIIAPAAWDVAWDQGMARLYAVNPGRSDVRAFSRTGAPDPMRSFDLRGRSAVFRAGLAGVAFDTDHDHIIAAAANGLLARLTRQGSVLETGVAAPLTGGGPLGYDAERDEIYALGGDGFVIVWQPDDNEERRRLSLWPALLSRPWFQPGGVCYDAASGNIVIADIQRPSVAVFEREGGFAGFLDYAGEPGGPGPRGGVAVRPGDGSLIFHGRFGAASDNGQISILTPPAPVSDLALRDDLLLTGFAHSAEAVITPYQLAGPGGPAETPRAASALELRPAAAVGGFAFPGAAQLFRLTASPEGAPILERWTFGAITAADPAWAQYE